ncbi:putative retrotransposable element tf2 155 kda protein type 1-like [Lyophyllum shimeji]|uniref:Retrotransposable element tf2 155 kDa protein type 1-like n=1 Tax=Lyophyllum shimeji TaxID=47721 RepID=A0A9P3UHV3_LYOSH|nr:putative retrotransposable element tf2 155 kda protein type 1-like [Lyophyllum shimeji]
MYSTRRTSGSHPLIPPDPALSPPASVLPPPASVLVPPGSPFLHRRIPDSRFIVAPRAPHITIQFLQGKGSLDLFSLDLPLPASYPRGTPAHHPHRLELPLQTPPVPEAREPIPKNKKEVQSFLGFTNFYQRFIRDFSYHTQPKDVAWTWGSAQQDAFDALERAITSKPVLIFPDDDHTFQVEADSSDFATGTVLFQQSPEDEKWHPVVFYSKSLNAVERNYEIYDKEMLAIICALEEWRHFLEGAQNKVEIYMDHKNL